MNVTLKKLLAMLTIAILVLTFIEADMRIAFSDEGGGKIDLFTEKEPYSGKGADLPSDAFGLGEVVMLYALVTHDEVPLQNLLVTFYVQSPGNMSFNLVAGTNASGIAAINFTIPQIFDNDSEIFGEWFTLAHVLVAGQVFQDSLTFKVDWIIKLISVRTIDENLTYRASFGIEGEVGLEIALRSIAMCLKSTLLAIVIRDELDVPISYLEIDYFEVQPNEKLIFLYCNLHIPKWAHIGNATVFISALTAPANQSGVPYCPAISARFLITSFEPMTIAFHDVAIVNVVPSATTVELGQPLNLNVNVRNEGTEDEGFNVSAYLDEVLIETFKVSALSPYSQTSLKFTLDTSLIDVGNYTIRVFIPYVINEADNTDNVFIDGVVEIKPKLPAIIHDIAIVDVKISNNTVYVGDSLQINVSVVNKGTETETFDIITYYDLSLIETLRVSALTPDAQVTLTSVWNTSFVCEGFYQIKASAPLSGDIDVSDNTFINGVVEVEAKPEPPPPSKIHDIAILNVTPSSKMMYIDETVDIYVVAENLGNYTESFNVTVFSDSNAVGTLLVENLESESEKTLVFHWNTEDVVEGNYTISAVASFIPDEVNVQNNFYVDGVVELRTSPPLPVIHDVAILWVDPDSNFTYIGKVLNISVIVKNLGDFAESFNVTVFYDSYAIETLLVENLESNNKTTLFFKWNTGNVREGNYTLSARASQVLGEENLQDNFYVDGIVEIIVAPTGWFHWFLLFLLLLVLAAILLIAWYYRRKRKKRAEESFNSGWIAWYYCHDLRKRPSKSRK